MLDFGSLAENGDIQDWSLRVQTLTEKAPRRIFPAT
jgi:hypothetical protein